MERCEEMTEAKYGDSCLESQHLRGSGWKGCYEFKANLGYIARLYREKRMWVRGNDWEYGPVTCLVLLDSWVQSSALHKTRGGSAHLKL